MVNRTGDVLLQPQQMEIVLDFVCVHSYLGFTRFLRAARRFREDGGEVTVTFAPFQLRPEASPVGEPLFEVHKRDRGEAVARQIAATPVGIEDGLDINLGDAIFVNTFEAHRLLAQASAQGHGESMAERLFRAYFTDGANIADPPTLSRLASEAGVVFSDTGSGQLHAELERVRRLGIESVPVFRFWDGTVLAGEQSVEAFRRVLSRADGTRSGQFGPNLCGG